VLLPQFRLEDSDDLRIFRFGLAPEEIQIWIFPDQLVSEAKRHFHQCPLRGE
jgi:hypothetical protein